MEQKELPNISPLLSSRAKSPKDYRTLAKQRGIIWVGLPVYNAQIKTLWACQKGHTWKAAYNTIQQGAGCPKCAGKARKTIDDYRALSRRKGILWIADAIPEKAELKTEWQCPTCDYQWVSSYETVTHGSGCPKCRQLEIADALRLSPSDYHDIASKRGIAWIGEFVQTANEKTLWHCPNCDHQWLSTHSYIRSGTGCPNCIDFVHGNRVSTQQRIIANMVNGEMNTKLGRKYIDVLIWRNGIKIAIEYDSWYWHGARPEADAKRDAVLVSAGYSVIHIHSNELLPSKDELENAIQAILSGCKVYTITLSDWGIGNCFHDYNPK